ncbi:lipoprotein [Lacrimispora brassicae]
MKRILFAILSVFILSGCNSSVYSNGAINNSEVINESSANVPKIQWGNSNGNIINGGYILKVDKNLFVNDNYIPSNGLLYQYDLNTKYMELVREDCKGSLNYYNNRLYYASERGIVGSDLDGSNVEIYYNNSCPFIIYNNMIYLVDRNIISVDIETKNITPLNHIFSENVNVVNDKIYYTSKDNMEENTVEELEKLDLWGGGIW